MSTLATLQHVLDAGGVAYLDKKLAERSLRHFVRVMWHAVEPARDLTPGWVIDAICEHLEAVTDGQIKRLLINCPPGCSKSLLTQVFWPAWEWGPRNLPHLRHLCASYSQGLTIRDNVRFRQIVQSPLYQQHWGERFGLSSEDASKIKFGNDKTGWKVATSVGGAVTGERADRVVCLPYEGVILTDRGPMAIGKVVNERLDVRVAGWSGSSVGWQTIERHEINPAARLVEIVAGAAVLRCTDDHLVWVVGAGWTPAGQIETGDCVISIGAGVSSMRGDIPDQAIADDAQEVLSREDARKTGTARDMAGEIVRSVRFLDDVPSLTYNVRVEPFHNYFADGILVHNCDDPNSVDGAQSEAIRTTTAQWLREVMPTRLNDPSKSAIVLIQQRTHEEDATGIIQQMRTDAEAHGVPDDWVHLMIPMEYDPDRHCETPIGWSDPRLKAGELAWPARFPRDVVEREKINLGPYAVAGQFQQMPAPRGGAILSRDWWRTWGDPAGAVGTKFPPFCLTIGVLDGAYTTKEQNDPSAMMVLGVFADHVTGHPQVMLVQAWTERLALHDLVTRVDATCKRCRVDTLLVENKASGISVAQELRRLFGSPDYGLLMVDPTGNDKLARAHAVAPMLAEGLVWRPVTDWSDRVVDQCAIFPRGRHDDLVDCLTHGLRWLREQDVLQRTQEVHERESMLARMPVRLPPLYRT